MPVPSVVDPATISYVLSSVASVGRILESVFNLSKRGITPTPEEFNKIENEAQQEAEQRAQAGAFSQSSIASAMSEEMIEVIAKEMAKIRERMKRAYRDETLQSDDKDKALALSRKEYCWHLKEMKRFSTNKVLPPDLQREWETNECDNFLL